HLFSSSLTLKSVIRSHYNNTCYIHIIHHCIKHVDCIPNPKYPSSPDSIHYSIFIPYCLFHTFLYSQHIGCVFLTVLRLFHSHPSLSLPVIMSSEKSKAASQTDGKAAQSKKSEMGMMSYKMFVFDQENFQGRMVEISNECMNVCELGMDRVRSLRVECGP
uniref:Crystallin, beta B1, like 1 n=1 Tax=Hucho hucho TaxID=62062 RepID=A0A4W5PJF4_9TELE